MSTVPGWSNNVASRAVAISKVSLSDTGLAAYLAGVDTRFRAGVLLHTGTRSVPFGDRWALPISTLWEH